MKRIPTQFDTGPLPATVATPTCSSCSCCCCCVATVTVGSTAIALAGQAEAKKNGVPERRWHSLWGGFAIPLAVLVGLIVFAAQYYLARNCTTVNIIDPLDPQFDDTYCSGTNSLPAVIVGALALFFFPWLMFRLVKARRAGLQALGAVLAMLVMIVVEGFSFAWVITPDALDAAWAYYLFLAVAIPGGIYLARRYYASDRFLRRGRGTPADPANPSAPSATSR